MRFACLPLIEPKVSGYGMHGGNMLGMNEFCKPQDAMNDDPR